MRFLAAVLFSISAPLLLAQDTTVISTLTFDSITTRRGWWEFPPATEQFRKVLMVHTLKCDPLTTWDQYNCGEWDYLTYQFIHEHTGVLDSAALTHPYFLVGTAAPDSADLASVNYDQVQRWYHFATVLQANNETLGIVGINNALDSGMLDPAGVPARSQYLFPSGDLAAAGVVPGAPIRQLRLALASIGGGLRFIVRMKNTAATSLQAFDETGLQTVYDASTLLAEDTLLITLLSPFTWDGVSNLLIDFTQENNGAGGGVLVRATDIGAPIGVQQRGRDGYVEMKNDFIGTDATALGGLGDAVTITFRAYGAPEIPVNTSFLEASDAQNRRQLNIHLPWSDGRVYWDAGNDGGGYDRIDKATVPANVEGQWNDWAFVKNVATGSMKIYLNGVLWHSGTGKTKPMAGIVRMKIGSDANGGNPYPGLIDEVNIFNTEVSAATIATWTGRRTDTMHPDHASLLYSFHFDESYTEPAAINAVDPVNPAWLMGTVRRDQLPASTLSSAPVQVSVRPDVTFVQGDHVVQLDSALTTDSRPGELLSLELFSEQGNSAAPTDTLFGGLGRWYYVYDPTGAVIDSVYGGGTVYQNDTVDYFGVPYEVVNDHEIGRYITPYGIGLDLGDDGFSWVYDVTDYQWLLHDSVELSAGNTQELIDLKFLMVQGTPPRPVVNTQRPWGPMRGYSYANLDNDNELSEVTVDLDPDATQWMLRSRLTGHGHNSNDGSYPHCCEWKDNTHYLFASGQEVDQWHIWLENDCANNPVYPQGGTWLGSREGWCPGNLVRDRDTELTPYADNGTLTIDYDITPVPLNNLGMGGGNYVINMDLFEFGPATHGLDAEIYDVRRPNDSGYRSRENPICHDPVVVLRNAGSTPLTSVTFSYHVSGGQVMQHIWTGNLAHMQRTEVTLPVGSPQFWAGDADQDFIIDIVNANGSTDGYADNDHYRTHFNMPVIYPDNFVIYYKTNNRPSENDLFVRDINGQVVFSRTTFTANTIYRDTLQLPPGCYELEFTDSGNDGLSYWADPDAGNGFFRFRSLTNQTLKTFETEFGHRIYTAFGIGTITGLNEVEQEIGFSARPNPSDGLFTLSVEGVEGIARIEVLDATGRVVWMISTQLMENRDIPLDLSPEPIGVYLVRLIHERGSALMRLAKR